MNNILNQLDASLNNPISKAETSLQDGKIDANENKLLQELVNLAPDDKGNNNNLQNTVNDYLQNKYPQLTESEQVAFKNKLVENLKIELTNLKPDNENLLYNINSKLNLLKEEIAKKNLIEVINAEPQKIKAKLDLQKEQVIPKEEITKIDAEIKRLNNSEGDAEKKEVLLAKKEALLAEQKIVSEKIDDLSEQQPLAESLTKIEKNQINSLPLKEDNNNNSSATTSEANDVKLPVIRNASKSQIAGTGTWLDAFGQDLHITLLATATAGISLASGILSLSADDKGPGIATLGLSLLAANYVKNRLNPEGMPTPDEFMDGPGFMKIFNQTSLKSDDELWDKDIKEKIKEKNASFVKELFLEQDKFCLFLGKMPAKTEKRFANWDQITQMNRDTVKGIDFDKFRSNFCGLQDKWKDKDIKNNAVAKSKCLKSFLDDSNGLGSKNKMIASLDDFIKAKEDQNYKLDNKKNYADEIIKEPEILDVIFQMLTWMNHVGIDNKKKSEIFQLYGNTVNARLGGASIADTALDFRF